MVKYAKNFYLLFTIYYVVKKWVVKVIRRYKRAYFRFSRVIFTSPSFLQPTLSQYSYVPPTSSMVRGRLSCESKERNNMCLLIRALARNVSIKVNFDNIIFHYRTLFKSNGCHWNTLGNLITPKPEIWTIFNPPFFISTHKIFHIFTTESHQ